jgi:hypothetical protein
MNLHLHALTVEPPHAGPAPGHSVAGPARAAACTGFWPSHRAPARLNRRRSLLASSRNRRARRRLEQPPCSIGVARHRPEPPQLHPAAPPLAGIIVNLIPKLEEEKRGRGRGRGEERG